MSDTEPQFDLQAGDVLFISPRFWRVVRFTPKRAYVERLGGIELGATAREADVPYVPVLGSDNVGYYLEVEFDFRRNNVARLIKFRGLSDDEIAERARQAANAMRPHAERVRALTDEIHTEQLQELATRRAHLLGSAT